MVVVVVGGVVAAVAVVVFLEVAPGAFWILGKLHLLKIVLSPGRRAHCECYQKVHALKILLSLEHHAHPESSRNLISRGASHSAIPWIQDLTKQS